MATDLRTGKDVVDRQFTTSSGTDVKDTKMLKGEAMDSLTGKNTVKPDMRNGGKSTFGRLGGLPN